jgi:hypothetical protein
MIVWILILVAAAFAALSLGESSVTGTSSKLSFADLEALAENAGFTGAAAIVAAAIALAESSGNPIAYNPELAAGAPQGKGSYGLWQIYLHAHPEFEGLNLYDPQTNANAAFKVYNDARGSFTPWSTFNSEAYAAHIPNGFSV